MKILIVRLSALGDVLHCLPSLLALRNQYPTATIDWVVEEMSAPILRSIPELDEVIVLPRKTWQRRLKRFDTSVFPEARSFVKTLRAREYNLAIDFQGNFRSGWVTFLSGARTRLGFSARFSRELNVLFTNRRVRPRGTNLHKIEKNFQLLSALDITGPPPQASLPPDPNAAAEAATFLKTLPAKKTRVVLHPGTSKFGDFKRWPEAHFVTLGQELARQADATLLVTWGPGEQELATRIAEGIGKAARVCCETSLPVLTEVIRSADLLVSGDTGPMNLAPLASTPAVTLFGPKDPAIYAPIADRSRVVVKDIPCRPCGLRKCPVVWCMKWIQPDEVLQPALALLNA